MAPLKEPTLKGSLEGTLKGSLKGSLGENPKGPKPPPSGLELLPSQQKAAPERFQSVLDIGFSTNLKDLKNLLNRARHLLVGTLGSQ